MVDSVTSQILVSGPRNLVLKLTNYSDGTGETGVVKVNAAAFTPPLGTHLTVIGIDFSVQGMVARLQWDATIPVDMQLLAGYGSFDFRRFAGLTCPNVAGVTGNILMTTAGQVAGSSYDIVLRMRKNVSP